jgi:predicted acyltransferase (DUF342 family)
MSGATSISSFLQASSPGFFFRNADVGDMIVRTVEKMHLGASNVGGSNAIDAALTLTKDDITFNTKLTLSNAHGAAALISSNSWVGLNLDPGSNPESMLDVNGDIRCRGNLHLSGDANIGGAIDVSSSNGRDNSLHVGGNTTLGSNVTIMGDLVTYGVAAFDSNVTVGQSLTVDSNATVTCDLLVSGNTQLDGSVTFGSNVTVNGELYVRDTLTVHGDSVLVGNSSNDGISTFLSNVDVYGGDVNMYGGNLSVGGVLSVVGDATLSNNLLLTDGGWIGINVSPPLFPVHINDATADNVSLFSLGKVLAQEFTVYSDLRIKRDVQYRDPAEYLAMLPRPCEYNYVDDAEHGFERRMGFIAQDVEKVVPCAVQTRTGFVPSVMAYADVVSRDPASLTFVLRLHGEAGAGVERGDTLKMRPSADCRSFTEAHVVAVEADAEDGDAKLATLLARAPLDLPGEGVDCVYVVGKRVDDFKVLNQEQLCAVTVGAVSSLYSMVTELQAAVARLQRLQRLQQAA